MFNKFMTVVVMLFSISSQCFAGNGKAKLSEDIDVIMPCSIEIDNISICGTNSVLLEFAIDPSITNKTENFSEATIIVCLSKKEVLELLREKDGPLLSQKNSLTDVKGTYLVANDSKPVTKKVFQEYRSGRDGYFNLIGK